jgi:GntR family transcriptional regulator/MocR family aminotransferase
LALLEWARKHDSLILEDDYDSEFRFETAPLPALAALGQDCTVYLGTFSKTIAPSLRVGYIVAPPALRERLLNLKTQSDYDTSIPVQIALAQFIQSGHFERHIRRMRRVYANKRQTLLENLAPIQHIAPLQGLEAGLHAHLELPETINAEDIVLQARKSGVNISTLESYYLERPEVNGLLLGYGGLSLEEIRTGASKLAQIILEHN